MRHMVTRLYMPQSVELGGFCVFDEHDTSSTKSHAQDHAQDHVRGTLDALMRALCAVHGKTTVDEALRSARGFDSGFDSARAAGAKRKRSDA